MKRLVFFIVYHSPSPFICFLLHYHIKMQETKDKDEILKEVREKIHLTYKETRIICIGLLFGNHKKERNNVKYLNY